MLKIQSNNYKRSRSLISSQISYISTFSLYSLILRFLAKLSESFVFLFLPPTMVTTRLQVLYFSPYLFLCFSNLYKR